MWSFELKNGKSNSMGGSYLSNFQRPNSGIFLMKAIITKRLMSIQMIIKEELKIENFHFLNFIECKKL